MVALAFIITFTQGVIFFGHWLLYQTFKTIFPDVSSQGYNIVALVLFILSVSFFLATLVGFRKENRILRIFYVASASWMGMAWNLVLGATVFWLLYPILLWLGLDSLIQLFGFLCLGFAFLVGIFGLVNARIMRVTRLSLNLINLVSNWRGKKIVLITDIHLGQVWHKEFAEKLVARVNLLKPDVIFIAGDMFDGTPVDQEHLTQIFKNFAAPYGTYFIMGNHDVYSGAERVQSALRAAGIKILTDEMVVIDDLQLMGVGYLETRTQDEFISIIKSFEHDKSKASILLKHVPRFVREAKELGVTLMLTGHTHKGQMWPFHILARRVHQGFGYDLHQLEDFFVYISHGVGSWGPPVRVGSRSEIVEIVLE